MGFLRLGSKVFTLTHTLYDNLKCYSRRVSTTTWTAKPLLQRTLFLLMKHPIFAFPVAIADLLGFGAMHIQHALHQPLFDLFLSDGGSVLSQSHGPFRLTPENASKAALLTFPLIWGVYFLSLYLYSTAMLTVSGLLSAAHSNEPVDISRMWEKKPKAQKRSLRYALFLLGLCVVGAAIVSLLFSLLHYIPLLRQKIGVDLGVIVWFVAGIAIVYPCASPTLRFLGKSDVAPNGAIVRLVRVFGVATLAIQFAVILLCRHLLPDFLFQQSTVMGFLVRQAIESLIGAFPYVLLFIALSVLVSEQPTSSLSVVEEVQS